MLDQPAQYDLGDIPHPSEFNLEGNMLIRSSVYKVVNGFDPLLFGHEGKELTRRCKEAYPSLDVFYYPQLIIRHDYAQGKRLASKQDRQILANEYIHYLKVQPLKQGISFLVRADDNHEFANDFIS